MEAPPVSSETPVESVEPAIGLQDDEKAKEDSTLTTSDIVVSDKPTEENVIESDDVKTNDSETVKASDADATTTPAPATNDNELSWDKIASEITDDPAASSSSVEGFELYDDDDGNTTKDGTTTEENSATNIEPVIEENSTELENSDTVTEENVEKDEEEVNDSVKTEVVIDSPEKNLTEIINISEVKDGEEGEAASEDVEYTVIETDDVETNEIIEKHLAQSSRNETYLIINESGEQCVVDEQGDSTSSYTEEVYVLEKEEEEVDEPQPEAKPKKQRGRKPITDLPLHVLGRDITKPSEGISNGGRVMPKPRLGVKVPYRNLTSQIVSKADIEKEIMDRFKIKQEQNLPASADVMFARKLTQRLAKKLIPDKMGISKSVASEADAAQSTSSKNDENNDAADKGIRDDSDLIAILEGKDDDGGSPKKIVTQVVAHVKGSGPQYLDPEQEREIALQQLKELPDTPPGKNRIFKSRTPATPVESKAAVVTAAKGKTPAKTASKAGEGEKKDVEPRLKTGVVVKTYTRKRRSTDQVETTPLPPKKAVTAAAAAAAATTSSAASSTPSVNSKSVEDNSSTSAYVTKSSRVIKRKVIWDPDETPTTKSAIIKSPKIEPNTSSSSTTSSTTPTQAKVAASKNVEKKVAAEVVAEKKTPEKKTVAVVKKIIGKTSPPIKKRLTEVDKLLMDEGALNMLYDIKTTEEANENKSNKKKQTKVKDFQSKTNAIKNDLQQTSTSKDSPKSLRKKDTATTSSTPSSASPIVKKTSSSSSLSAKKDNKEQQNAAPITRKKSKDSARSSIHSPPASPGFSQETSRIIRRHSSSSFSSNDEVEEIEENVADEPRVTRKRASQSASSNTASTNESSAAPAKKRGKKTSESKTAKETSTPPSKTNNNNVNHKDDNNVVKTTIKEYKMFSTRQTDRLVEIILSNKDDECYLSDVLLKELIQCLKECGDDDEVNVVSITSNNNKVFCWGLNYRDLIIADEGARKKKSNELATLVKDFLKCLLHFPKVLIAGIEGECVGLGVTMLSLFDIVIASDTATFSTSYAKLGCVAEAGFLLTVPHLGNHGLASELLYTSQVLKADDVFRRGLITRLCWPEKYKQDLQNILTDVAQGSSQGMEASKLQLRQHIIDVTEKSLNSLNKKLVEHWTSAECQEKFINCKIDPE